MDSKQKLMPALFLPTFPHPTTTAAKYQEKILLLKCTENGESTTPIVGINHKVIKYGDDNGNIIRILHSPDPIDKEVIFYCTLGLSKLVPDNNHTELFFASYSNFKEAPNLLSTCAFFLINQKWKSEKGGVFETLLEMYYPSSQMKHIYFTSPYLWEDKLEGFSLEGKKVNFLLAIPISDQELEYRNLNGYLALENLFEEKSVDIFDLDRESVV